MMPQEDFKKADAVVIPELQHHLREVAECCVCGRWRTHDKFQGGGSRICSFCLDAANHRDEIETFNPLDHEQTK